MRNVDTVNINKLNIKDNEIELVLVPRHKYSFIYNDSCYG